MAIIFQDSTIYLAYNDQIVRGARRDFMNVVAGDLGGREAFKSFFVGGYAEDALIIQEGRLLAREAYFHGEIDAIRFSNIARYDLPAEAGFFPFEPPHRFVSDAHTLALWDFNDKAGADRFEDTSENEYTLISFSATFRKKAGFMTFLPFYARNGVEKRVYISISMRLRNFTKGLNCTAIENLGHCLNKDCGTMKLWPKGAFDGQTKKRHARF